MSKKKARLRDLNVREVSFVGKAAVRDLDGTGQSNPDQPMRFLLWKEEDCADCPDDVTKAELSSQERDALPDSAFADSQNRRYPIKRKDGSWDKAHIANARARCADPKNSCGPQVKKRIDAAARAAGIGDDVQKKETADVELKEALAIVRKAAQAGQIEEEDAEEIFKDDLEEDRVAIEKDWAKWDAEHKGKKFGVSEAHTVLGVAGHDHALDLMKKGHSPEKALDRVASFFTSSGKKRVQRHRASLVAHLKEHKVQKEEDVDGAVPSEEDLVEILKSDGVVPAVRAMIQKAEDRAREAEKDLQQLRLEKAEVEVRTQLAKAEEFVAGLPYLGISEEGRTQVAKALFVLRREDEDAAGELEKVLKTQDTRLRTSALWESLGVSGETGQRHGSASGELQARAVELRKSEKELTIDQARAQILEEDPDLATRLDEEGIQG